MAKEIVWTPNCKENYKDIIEYLLDISSFETALKFTIQLEDWLEILSKNPFLGISNPTFISVQKLLIPPHNQLAYTVIENQIILLNIVDTRK